MAIIRQQRLFSWREIEDLQDLERLKLVLEHIPDEALLRDLEKERGRDDPPVRGIWNSILAGVLYEHESIESLRRDLGRNAQMRELCGLTRVPSAAAYTRLLKSLLCRQAELDAVFNRLMSKLSSEPISMPESRFRAFRRRKPAWLRHRVSPYARKQPGSATEPNGGAGARRRSRCT